MEQVGPCSEMETQMRLFWPIPSFHSTLSGGTFVFPLFAALLLTALPFSASQGHGTEFIFAKFRHDEATGSIELRLALDFLANPLVMDEETARSALEQAIEVVRDGESVPFTQLAPLVLEESSSWDEAVPDSLIPPSEESPHHFLLGTWTWQADVEEFAFAVKRGSRHDVLLWSQPVGQEVKTSLLLGGDISPSFTVAAATDPWWFSWLLIPSVALVWICRQRRNHAGPQRSC